MDEVEVENVGSPHKANNLFYSSIIGRAQNSTSLFHDTLSLVRDKLDSSSPIEDFNNFHRICIAIEQTVRELQGYAERLRAGVVGPVRELLQQPTGSLTSTNTNRPPTFVNVVGSSSNSHGASVNRSSRDVEAEDVSRPTSESLEDVSADSVEDNDGDLNIEGVLPSSDGEVSQELESSSKSSTSPTGEDGSPDGNQDKTDENDSEGALESDDGVVSEDMESMDDKISQPPVHGSAQKYQASVGVEVEAADKSHYFSRPSANDEGPPPSGNEGAECLGIGAVTSVDIEVNLNFSDSGESGVGTNARICNESLSDRLEVTLPRIPEKEIQKYLSSKSIGSNLDSSSSGRPTQNNLDIDVAIDVYHLMSNRTTKEPQLPIPRSTRRTRSSMPSLRKPAAGQRRGRKRIIPLSSLSDTEEDFMPLTPGYEKYSQEQSESVQSYSSDFIDDEEIEPDTETNNEDSERSFHDDSCSEKTKDSDCAEDVALDTRNLELNCPKLTRSTTWVEMEPLRPETLNILKEKAYVILEESSEEDKNELEREVDSLLKSVTTYNSAKRNRKRTKVKPGTSEKKPETARNKTVYKRISEENVDDWICSSDTEDESDTAKHDGQVPNLDLSAVCTPASESSDPLQPNSVAQASPLEPLTVEPAVDFANDSCESESGDMREVCPEIQSAKLKKTNSIMGKKRHAHNWSRPKLITPGMLLSSSSSDSDSDSNEVVEVVESKAKIELYPDSNASIITINLSSEVTPSESEETCNKSKLMSDISSSDEADEIIRRSRKKRTRARSLTPSSSSEDDTLPELATNTKLPVPIRSGFTLSDLMATSSNSIVVAPPPRSRKRRRRRVRSVEVVAEATQIAEELERERLRRLEENQKLQHQPVLPTSTVQLASAFVLEYDVATKEPLVAVDRSISDKLKPHQREGVKFLWDNCFGSILDDKPGGCVLAHLMGLGKTFQTIAFLHTVMSKKVCGVRKSLILCPLSISKNWEKEWQHWLKNATQGINVYNVSAANIGEDVQMLRRWKKTGGLVIMHYESLLVLLRPDKKALELPVSFSQLACQSTTLSPITLTPVFDEAKAVKTPSQTKKKPYSTEEMEELLLNPGPDILVCDEGHTLKNHKTHINLIVNRFATKRRIILTGTPLQNNLLEYYSMIEIIKPGLLGTRREFEARYVYPIDVGIYKNSTENDVRKMRRKTFALAQILKGCVQRKDSSIYKDILAPKYEYALVVNLTPLQNLLYDEYMKMFLAGRSDATQRRTMLKDYNLLQRICCHPKALLPAYYYGCATRRQPSQSAPRTKGEDQEEDAMNELLGDGIQTPWYAPFLPMDTISSGELHSYKLALLKKIVAGCAELGDKLLIFSKYQYALNVIEEFIKEECPGDWRAGETYFKLDGKTVKKLRHKYCESFNESSRARVFLLTTKTGGLGFNLHGANRVILFDVSMNPTDDSQSIFRCYRLGQEKVCYVYRFVSRGGMENVTFVRTVIKLALARRVVDEGIVNRHFAIEDRSNIYKFTRTDDSEPAKTPPIPEEDQILQDLLKLPAPNSSHPDQPKTRKWIYNYCEVETLLNNNNEEDLNEEEKDLARSEANKPLEVKQKGKPGPKGKGKRQIDTQAGPAASNPDESSNSADPAMNVSTANIDLNDEEKKRSETRNPLDAKQNGTPGPKAKAKGTIQTPAVQYIPGQSSSANPTALVANPVKSSSVMTLSTTNADLSKDLSTPELTLTPKKPERNIPRPNEFTKVGVRGPSSTPLYRVPAHDTFPGFLVFDTLFNFLHRRYPNLVGIQLQGRVTELRKRMDAFEKVWSQLKKRNFSSVAQKKVLIESYQLALSCIVEKLGNMTDYEEIRKLLGQEPLPNFSEIQSEFLTEGNGPSSQHHPDMIQPPTVLHLTLDPSQLCNLPTKATSPTGNKENVVELVSGENDNERFEKSTLPPTKKAKLG